MRSKKALIIMSYIRVGTHFFDHNSWRIYTLLKASAAMVNKSFGSGKTRTSDGEKTNGREYPIAKNAKKKKSVFLPSCHSKAVFLGSAKHPPVAYQIDKTRKLFFREIQSLNHIYEEGRRREGQQVRWTLDAHTSRVRLHRLRQPCVTLHTFSVVMATHFRVSQHTAHVPLP